MPREVTEAEALEQRLDRRRCAVAHIAEDGQVREERVILEHEAHRTALWRQVDPPGYVEPGLAARLDPPPPRPHEPCDCPQQARLARPRRTGERERLAGADLETQLEGERPKRKIEVDAERVHDGITLAARRMAMLKTTSSEPSASATSKSWSSDA